MIRILIVDDSETETAILKHIFESSDNLNVIACAKNGKEAIELNKRLSPDIITMDIQMPVMDGLEATRLIMSQHPTPIVVISSRLQKELQITFRALEAGALTVLDKPKDINSPKFASVNKRMIDVIQNMAEIKVIKRRYVIKPKHLPHKIAPSNITIPHARNYEIIAIGTSIGGPLALKIILSKLPKDFSLPILVVQHMTKGFLNGFIQWLNDNTLLNVKSAEDGECLQKSTVYFAPDHFHLEIERKNEQLYAKLSKGLPVSGFCPSATVLLNSVAKTCGKNAIGILLTGMGSDGADGLLTLKNAQGHTLIQDENSTIVFGMAGVAQSLGAVDKIVELDQMAEYLTRIV